MASSFTQAQVVKAGNLKHVYATPEDFKYDEPVTITYDLTGTTFTAGQDLYWWNWTPKNVDAEFNNSSEKTKLTYVSDMIWEKTFTPTEYYGMTPEQIFATETGYFWFLIKDQAGTIESGAASVHSSNDGGLATKSAYYNNSITVYPNPATSHITIDYGTVTSLTGNQVKVTNTLGQEVFSQTMNTKQQIIPVSNWAKNGMYFVKIQDAKGNVLNIKKLLLK